MILTSEYGTTCVQYSGKSVLQAYFHRLGASKRHSALRREQQSVCALLWTCLLWCWNYTELYWRKRYVLHYLIGHGRYLYSVCLDVWLYYPTRLHLNAYTLARFMITRRLRKISDIPETSSHVVHYLEYDFQQKVVMDIIYNPKSMNLVFTTQILRLIWINLSWKPWTIHRVWTFLTNYL